jgi:hypothetical protein
MGDPTLSLFGENGVAISSNFALLEYSKLPGTHRMREVFEWTGMNRSAPGSIGRAGEEFDCEFRLIGDQLDVAFEVLSCGKVQSSRHGRRRAAENEPVDVRFRNPRGLPPEGTNSNVSVSIARYCQHAVVKLTAW